MVGGVIGVVGRAAGTVFGIASHVRRTKSLHPHGLVHEASLTLDGVDDPSLGFLAEAGEHGGVVRLSRGAGLPKPLPDFIGLAIRLADVHGPGRHQDFLLLTSGEGAGVQHLFRPSLSITDGPYSTILPYTGGGDQFIIGARPLDEHRFEIGVTSLKGRHMRRIGELRLGARRPAAANAITFNPWNTGGGIEPAGALNKLRRWAYPGSQAGWAATSDGSSDMTVKTESESPSEIGSVRPA